jgi:hypothetical protein
MNLLQFRHGLTQRRHDAQHVRRTPLYAVAQDIGRGVCQLALRRILRDLACAHGGEVGAGEG